MSLDAEQAGISVLATIAERANFACQQNDVPLLRDLALLNDSSESLSDLTIEISSEPRFLKARTWRVDRLLPGDQVNVNDRRVDLDPGVLWELSEAVSASVIVRVLSDGLELARREQTVELLARNEWGGIAHMPEMVAAFVTPNDPAIDSILKRASQVLQNAGFPAGLDGYQSSSPQRAAQLASAIWSSIGAMRLSYANPPASFEVNGQKVRTPSHIAEGGIATCLDLTLLFASALEQAGLYPIVVFTKGHCFVGCWLQDEQFANVTVDDVTSLRKRIQIQEALFFESTLTTQQPVPKFRVAIKQARDLLSEANDERFELAVDVRRARMQRIRPIPTGREPSPTQGSSEHAGSSQDASELEAFADLPGETSGADFDTGAPETPTSRLDRWQRKLLDLSLRNRLLNFKPSKRSISIRCPNPGQLEDQLADGRKIQIVASPRMMDEEQGRSAQHHRQQHNEDAEEAYALDALHRDEVVVDLSPTELDRRLVELFRAARASLQEGGANTLFLAFGFLAWRKADGKDEKRYRAPLILVPVHLERRSVRSGMRLVIHDDEPRVNPTLLQMLEQDFALKVPELTGPLPTDEHGLDVPGIWSAMTRAIRDQEGWEVVEEVTLATFSFSKYLMWKDLVDRTDVLKENPVVRHLIDTPKELYASAIAFPEPRVLDEEYPPERTFTPLPADSSQLAAVMAAAGGKDFVLEGPPGTGKSQTISNMIAQCLAEGRSVLFVSEKTAALDVVYRRLRDVGLGEFCLELHSSKARKLDVLEQLRTSWESAATLDAEEWHREATRLAELRSRLNLFVDRLHRRYPNGLTAHQAIGKVVSGEDVPIVALSWASPEDHTRDAIDGLRDIAERIDIDSAEIGNVAESAFQGIDVSDWAPTWQQKLIDGSRQTLPTIRDCRLAAEAFEKACGLNEMPLSKARLDALSTLSTILPHAYGEDYGFVLEPRGPKILSALKDALGLLVERQRLASELSCDYRPDALANLPVADLAQLWEEAGTKRWPASALRRRKVNRTLRSALSSRAKPNVSSDLENIARIQSLDSELAGYDELSAQTNGIWAGLDTRIEEANKSIDLLQRLRVAGSSLAGTPEALVESQAALRRLLTDGNALLAEEAPVGKAADQLLKAKQTMEEQLRHIETLACSSADEIVANSAPDWLQSLSERLQSWVNQQNRLRAWCAWRNVRNEALANGLTPLVEAVEAGAVAPGSVLEAFEVNYSRWWIVAVVDRDDVLRSFVPAEHERLIAEFARLDEEFMRLTRDYVRAKLCGQLPAKDEVTRSSEWGVLKRELEKKRRHKPLRQLVEEMPTALTKLTPCLLMSPLSIAQYLSPEHAHFDIVIFDEASQIPVWDAVGAIARAKQAVIVGDPKQLPPTSFFERADDEDYDDEDVERDLESILDECMGANLPVERLNWHYRSRHESLIAFSNQRYYGGSLVTFPAPVTEDRAVSYHHVSDGAYEKGGARINQAEAKALVGDIVRRITDPEFKKLGHSIGVVTFNTEQQRLIEDLLDEERRKNAAIESWFDEDQIEPIMVKNLESVQGDERDIIYFSITYGPDRQGRVSMNFGPLNRDGGERRLNVAITRARREIRVFATLTPDQINLARTQAIGVRDFKHFLEYAERGPRALAEATHLGGGDFDSPFEQAVATALVERGWEIHPQVGVSGFRVDLGIVHPDAPGTYLAGVECDGATYHRAATARDRDKLREAVLRGLGWEILRVWSTDWWIDRSGATEKLDRRLNELLDKSRESDRADETDVVPEEEVPPKTPASVEVAITSTGSERASRAPSTFEESGRADPGEAERQPLYAEAPALTRSTPAPPPQFAGASLVIPYRECDFATFQSLIDADRFYEPSYAKVLGSMLDELIEVEGPIRDDVLVRRLAREHGFQRAGRRIRECVLKIANRKAQKTRESVGTFYWPNGVTPEQWRWFRHPLPEEPRAIEDIAIEELRILAHHFDHQGLAGDDKVRAMAAECGVQRLSSTIRARLEKALGSAEDE